MIAITVLGAPPASAATTIGQTAPSPADTFNCGVASLFVQRQVAAPPDYVIPAGGGVITSWSVMGQSAGQLKLKIVRRTATSTYEILAEDTLRMLAPAVLNTFNTRISVTGGELLALWVPGPGNPCTFTNTELGDQQEFRSGGSAEPAIGQMFQTNTIETAHRINVSASLEPDCDNDGFGDETQDPEATGPNCPPQPGPLKANRTLTLDANKSKVKKGKRVTLSGRLSAATGQGPCESSQTVELQRKRPKQTAFTTFAQVQTDTQGSFSLKKKVKKTFEFRAQVVETAACTAAQSNSEKVKVKKKRR